MKINFQSIGTIRTPFKEKQGMPIQPKGAAGVQGVIELKEELSPGLQDLEDFSHVFLIYHLHQSEGYELEVTPFLDNQKHGVFATRAPRRPNPIGLSVVELLKIEGNVLYIRNVDMLDGTPLLDIKPYVADFDAPRMSRKGWLEKNAGKADDFRSDDRFE
jgi:tRNA-Thr(GGU) m(6)t(6)A37 methyltransferase TsaA